MGDSSLEIRLLVGNVGGKASREQATHLPYKPGLQTPSFAKMAETLARGPPGWRKFSGSFTYLVKLNRPRNRSTFSRRPLLDSFHISRSHSSTAARLTTARERSGFLDSSRGGGGLNEAIYEAQ